MPLILGTNSIKDTGFNVANSLRFNNGSSDYLNRTLGTPTNQKKFTVSAWIKISKLGLSDGNYIIGQKSTNEAYFRIDSTNHLWFSDRAATSGNPHILLSSNALLRDTSAWYHVMVAVDTTQGTDTNRAKMYINGSQITSFSSTIYPSQNYDTMFNLSGATQNVGYTYDYYDGYMSEVVFIDGQALDPTSFGEFDEDSGIWKPKDVSGLTFGTNGFYLDFEDSSALGNDAAGSNNFTVNNLTAVDQSTDTCTNNFCTMNPLDNFYQGATFSEGNIKLVTYSGSGKYTWSTSTIGVSSGKWYWEVKVSSTGNDFDTIGFAPSVSTSATAILGDTTNSVGWHGYNGQFRKAASVLATLSTYTTNDILSFALDLDNNLIYVYKNGSIQNSGTGISITAAASVSSGFYFPAAGTNDNAAGTYEFNFGSPSFSISSGNTDGNGYGNMEFAVPSGYFVLNSKNLAEYG